jgi:type II secretory pathway predicted ATPase ExeA
MVVSLRAVPSSEPDRAGPSKQRLVSRRDVIAHLEQAIRRGDGAVIIGEAGIGKSHAARALARRLGARGAVVELVLATEAASTIPFGALAGLLTPASDTAGDLLDVLRTTGDRLERRARGGMLVLIVDDAHRLDPASAALLLQLVTRHGIRVLATVRAGAMAPDAVTALWKDAGLFRVDLAPLSDDAAGELMRHLLRRPGRTRYAALAVGDERRESPVPA